MDRAEIFNDGCIRVGLTITADKQLYPNLDKISGQLIIGNVSRTRFKIDTFQIEGSSLLQDFTGNQVRIIVSPGQSHPIDFEIESTPLHMKIHKVLIEYTSDDQDLETTSKSSFLLPILPFIRYNKSSGFVDERLVNLWEKVVVGWEKIVSEKLVIDATLFPDSQSISELIPNMKIIREAEVGDYNSGQHPPLIGLFQISAKCVLIVKVTFLNPVSFYLLAKYPESSQEGMASYQEIEAVFSHLIALLSISHSKTPFNNNPTILNNPIVADTTALHSNAY